MTRVLIILLPLVTLMPAFAAENNSIDRLALAGDQASINALRAEGAAGLAKLLVAYGSEDKPGLTESAAIDAVAGQKDAYASRLYWYTDLDAAKATAQREGKPILSLRMLGRLDE